jgi:hypothetical protein
MNKINKIKSWKQKKEKLEIIRDLNISVLIERLIDREEKKLKIVSEIDFISPLRNRDTQGMADLIGDIIPAIAGDKRSSLIFIQNLNKLFFYIDGKESEKKILKQQLKVLRTYFKAILVHINKAEKILQSQSRKLISTDLLDKFQKNYDFFKSKEGLSFLSNMTTPITELKDS